MTQAGPAVVASVRPSAGRYRVFNLEVEAEHEYYVGAVGLRAHNVCAKRIAELRARVRALGLDPATGRFRLREGVAGARVEAFLGRPLSRSADEAADFIDDVLGPISLKGPIPRRGSIDGLIASSIKDGRFNSETNALLVDLGRLPSSVVSSARAQIIEGIGGAKPVFFPR